MLSIQIETMAVDVGTDEGMTPPITVQVTGGTALPFADPSNPNRPVVIPSTQVNFGLNKAAAKKLIELLQENVDKLPDEASGKIVTANSLQGVDEIARAQSALTSAR